jgi:short-subunit dehydrogenase
MPGYELQGRCALITGASSGIGWALAKEVSRRGARPALLARRADRLERLAREIAEETGIDPVVVRADLSAPGDAVAAAEIVLDRLGRVDVLVNNAGGAVGGSVWAVADRPEARADFEVDFWSPLALIGALVPAMRRRGDGVVVNVTSLRQVITWPSFGQNSAAQAALAAATETLRLELDRYGVHVVEVIPGPVETAVQGPTGLLPGIREAFHDRLGVADPRELARAVAAAIEEGADRVFCPEATGRWVYERPVEARARLRADVRRLLDPLPANEAVDTLVVGADHPLMLTAREQWESEHGADA